MKIWIKIITTQDFKIWPNKTPRNSAPKTKYKNEGKSTKFKRSIFVETPIATNNTAPTQHCTFTSKINTMAFLPSTLSSPAPITFEAARRRLLSPIPPSTESSLCFLRPAFRKSTKEFNYIKKGTSARYYSKSQRSLPTSSQKILMSLPAWKSSMTWKNRWIQWWRWWGKSWRDPWANCFAPCSRWRWATRRFCTWVSVYKHKVRRWLNV